MHAKHNIKKKKKVLYKDKCVGVDTQLVCVCGGGGGGGGEQVSEIGVRGNKSMDLACYQQKAYVMGTAITPVPLVPRYKNEHTNQCDKKKCKL